MTSWTSRDGRRRRTRRTPARHRCRFHHPEVRTRLQVSEALVRLDCRCDCGTGVCGGGGVGRNEAGGEGIRRGVDDFKRPEGEGDGEEAVEGVLT